jgi:aromatic ring-opening dioxygenase catalytic subunit (LigB family)
MVHMGALKMPAVFVPHGGGPWPFVEIPAFDDPVGAPALKRYLQSVAQLPPAPPKALLVISAHWEAPVPTVMSGAQPPLFFDYYGFPPEAYTLTWPAPGSPELAARVRQLLEGAGFASAEDPVRGFDHGTFVPLKLAYPEAQVPVVQLSLIEGLDPEAHLRMGRALSPLRSEGIFIVGSGMTYHNLRRFLDPAARAIAERFDEWLRMTATLPEVERDAQLIAWKRAPDARDAHPREEHLIPLHVIAGAAGSDRGSVAYNETYLGLRLSAYHF